jgi:hypothetical protein
LAKTARKLPRKAVAATATTTVMARQTPILGTSIALQLLGGGPTPYRYGELARDGMEGADGI